MFNVFLLPGCFWKGVWSLRTGPPVGPAMVIEEKAG